MENINTFSMRQYRKAVEQYRDKGCEMYINSKGGTEMRLYRITIAIIWKNF
jgi:hypothetical protein